MASLNDILIRIITQGDPEGAEEVGNALEDLAQKGERAEAAGGKLSLLVTGPLLAFAALAVQQASDTAGLTREIEELDEANKELLRTFGDQMLPVITPIIGGLKNTANVIADLEPQIKTLLITVGGTAAAAGPLLLTFGAIVKTLHDLQLISTKALAGLKFGSAIAGAAALGIALGTSLDQLTGFSDKVAELSQNQALQALTEEFDEQSRLLFEQARAVENENQLWQLNLNIATERGRLLKTLGDARRGELDISREEVRAIEQQLVIYDRMLGTLGTLIQRNQERAAANAAAAAAAEREAAAKEKLLDLDAEQLAKRDEIITTYALEKALLQARASGDDQAIATAKERLDIYRAELALKASGLLHDDEARAFAREKVKLEREALEGDKARAEAKQRELEAQRAINAETKKGIEEQRRLRDGLREESYRDVSGESQTRIFDERGRIVDDSGSPDAFRRVPSTYYEGTTPPPSSTPTTPNPSTTPTTPTPSTPSTTPTPSTPSQVPNVTLDTSALHAAILAMADRLQTQINDLAAQIQSLAN